MLPTDNAIDNEDQPQEGEAPARGSSKLVLWLIICGLGVLFLPLYIISTTVKTTNEELTTELADIEATLSATPPVPAELQTLSAEFTRSQHGREEENAKGHRAAQQDLPRLVGHRHQV